MSEGTKTNIDPKHLDAFKKLRRWCRDNQCIIYADNNGCVCFCIRDTHYRAHMIGKSFACWEPFDRVTYDKVFKEDDK